MNERPRQAGVPRATSRLSRRRRLALWPGDVSYLHSIRFNLSGREDTRSHSYIVLWTLLRRNEPAPRAYQIARLRLCLRQSHHRSTHEQLISTSLGEEVQHPYTLKALSEHCLYNQVAVEHCLIAKPQLCASRGIITNRNHSVKKREEECGGKKS